MNVPMIVQRSQLPASTVFPMFCSLFVLYFCVCSRGQILPLVGACPSRLHVGSAALFVEAAKDWYGGETV